MAIIAMVAAVDEFKLVEASELDAPIQLAWAGMLRAIDPDGTVHGIACGTDIQQSVEAYQLRPTPWLGSVPGVGAVMQATLAVARYTNSGARGLSHAVGEIEAR